VHFRRLLHSVTLSLQIPRLQTAGSRESVEKGVGERNGEVQDGEEGAKVLRRDMEKR